MEKVKHTVPHGKYLLLVLQVRSLVSEEMFARYDRLLLQLSLDGMEDVTNCPRIDCQSPVLKEEDSTMAVCPSCHLAFCTLCNMAYHGVSPCRIKKGEYLSPCLQKLCIQFQHFLTTFSHAFPTIS